MTGIDHLAVIVPAANEERHIGRCLDSILLAAEHTRAMVDQLAIDIIVVLDRCTDRTEARARALGAHLIHIDERCVGAARQAGAAAAIERALCPLTAIWLANSDADSQVPSDWLCGQLAAAQSGMAAMTGVVLPDEAGPTIERWYSRHDLVSGHPYVHGANLGVRADALLAVGGWPRLRSGEDVSLISRLAGAGLLISRSADYPVVTSARRVGRAPRGFSGYLATLDKASGHAVTSVASAVHPWSPTGPPPVEP